MTGMKKGFTLAEVLITLGIIGVVAALTAPALVQNTANAQVGPTLAKVKSSIETANEALLNDQGVSGLDKLGALDGYEQDSLGLYPNYLVNYISGSAVLGGSNDFEPVLTKYDGSEYEYDASALQLFKFSDTISLYIRREAGYGEKGSFKGQHSKLFVDINGHKTGPNSLGKDVFLMYIDNGGSVVPAGGSTYAWLVNDESKRYDAAEGDFACNADTVGSGEGCAGSVFENNLKVIY